MKRFFCLRTIAFYHYGNDETSGQDLPISDGQETIDLDALQESAEHGDVEAQCRLAYCLYSGRFTKRVKNGIETICRDINKAFSWWSIAARHGNANAQYWLGYCYYHGEGTPVNRTESLRWFQLAAEQGDADAQYYLGICYWDGEGTTANKKEAFRWFRIAAEQGVVDAQYYLGICYWKGEEIEENIEKNIDEAIRWLRCAAAQDHRKAIMFLDRHGIKKNDTP